MDVFAERIDLAVRLGLLADSTLIAQQLMRTYYRVCASPNYLQRYGHPERPSDIEAHNCLLFPLPGFRSRWIFRDRDGVISEVPVHGRTMHLECDRPAAMCDRGNGLGLVAKLAD